MLFLIPIERTENL